MKKPIIRGGSAALATLMTASLVTPMAPVMAAALPSAADTSSITVMNVDHKFNNREIDGISVTAYKIIEPVYDTANGGKGLLKYKLVDAVSAAHLGIADMEHPTSEEVTAIARAIANGTLSLTPIELEDDDLDGTWTKSELGAGSYLVLVDGGVDTESDRNANTAIYAPMLVSINYSDANDASTIGKHITPETPVENDANKNHITYVRNDRLVSGSDPVYIKLTDGSYVLESDWNSVDYAPKANDGFKYEKKVNAGVSSFEEFENGTFYKLPTASQTDSNGNGVIDEEEKYTTDPSVAEVEYMESENGTFYRHGDAAPYTYDTTAPAAEYEVAVDGGLVKNITDPANPTFVAKTDALMLAANIEHIADANGMYFKKADGSYTVNQAEADPTDGGQRYSVPLYQQKAVQMYARKAYRQVVSRVNPDQPVDAETVFGYGTVAYAKKSQPTLEKNIKVTGGDPVYKYTEDAAGTYTFLTDVKEYVLISDTVTNAHPTDGKKYVREVDKVYVEAENGTYYKDADGTYKLVSEWDAANQGNSDTLEKRYNLVDAAEPSLVKGDVVSAKGTNTTQADDITFQIDTKIPSYVSGAEYTEDSNGDWYRLIASKGGNYTQTAPTASTDDVHDITSYKNYVGGAVSGSTASATKYKESTKKTAYQNVRFEVSDSLDETFDVIDFSAANFKVQYKDALGALQDVPAAAYTLTQDADQKGFQIRFGEDYILNHAYQDIVITYKTKLNDSIDAQNFAENHNRATLTYSNDPQDGTSFKTVDKDTYHYTFALDGNIDAESQVTDGEKETHELNKVTEAMATAGSYVDSRESLDETDSEITKKSQKALAGAIFGLYTTEANANAAARKGAANGAIAESTSDANGHFTFTGLDEGTYFIKEVQAPAGYTRSDVLYKAEIRAELDSDGILKAYHVIITQKAPGATEWKACGKASYTVSEFTKNNDGSIDYSKNGASTISGVETTVPMEVIDTRLLNLPSTGGMGTMPFIISGIVAMSGAALLLGLMKKREAKA